MIHLSSRTLGLWLAEAIYYCNNMGGKWWSRDQRWERGDGGNKPCIHRTISWKIITIQKHQKMQYVYRFSGGQKKKCSYPKLECLSLNLGSIPDSKFLLMCVFAGCGNGSNGYLLATHMRDPNSVPSSQLQPRPTPPSYSGHWGVNHWMKHAPSYSLSRFASNNF